LPVYNNAPPFDAGMVRLSADRRREEREGI